MPVLVDYGGGSLAISTIPLATAAWRIRDLTPLFDALDQRGDDLLIPGTDGELPQPRRESGTRHSFVMDFWGEHDSDGVAIANPRLGLITNIDYIKANVVAPPGTATGTRAAVWTLPGGGTRSATVTVESLTFLRKAPTWAVGRLGIKIHAPGFA